MQPFETLEYKGYTIKLFFDEDPMNPRENDVNLGKMICSHNRYTLGDKQSDDFGSLLLQAMIDNGLDYDDYYRHFTPLTDELKQHCADVRTWPDEQGFGYTPYYTFEDFVDDLERNDESCIKEALERLANHIIIMPLYLYEHGGITMNTTGFSCQWDSGQVGIVWLDIAKAKKDMGWVLLTANRREHLETMLRNEVAVYDTYIRGAFCGYEVSKDDEDIDSCWGFDDAEWAMKEAKSAANCDIREAQ